MREKEIAGKKLELVQGDITTQTTDAIVNAANSSLLGGGGVDGAIHRAGGPQILEECKAIRARQGPCPAGEAVITSGGKLPARHVVHAVGPIWRGGSEGEPETLASAYRRSLEIAVAHGVRSIAFPSISTGAYRYPVRQAANVALETVKDFLARERRAPELVRFVLFDAETLRAYEEALTTI